MSILSKLKANKKTVWYIVGLVAVIGVGVLVFLYIRRRITPKIYSAQPKSAADEIAFIDLIAKIKSNPFSGAASDEGLSAILKKAGDDYTAGIVGAQWGNSKTGALMGSIDFYQQTPTARPIIGGKLGSKVWMTGTTYDACLSRWQQYKTAEPF